MKTNKLSRSQNNKIVRKKNIQAMLRLIRKYEPVTTETLIIKSGLSYPTVFGIIKELVDVGVLEKKGYASSTGGRQAVLYSICANFNYTMGIHVYTRWISLTISNLTGGKVYETTENNNVLEMSQEKLLLELKNKVLKASADANIPFDKLTGICICFSEDLYSRLKPAVDTSSSIVGMIEDLTGAETSEVVDSAILNYLERKKFPHAKLNRYIHVSFGLSIGVTVYGNDSDNDHIIGTCGMLGHTIVVPDGYVCQCGKHGCLETYYNGPALYSHYAAECASRGLMLMEYDELAKKGLFRSLLFRCFHNDQAAIEAINSAIKILGIALANLIITLGISTMVVSGLMNSNEISYFNKISEHVLNNLSPGSNETELILGMALPEDCSYGACLMLNHKYFDRYHSATKPDTGLL